MMITSKNNNLTYTYVVAGVVIRKDGKYLLVQEKQPNCYGKWNLPAGKVEKGHTIEETAIKEAKESMTTTCTSEVHLGFDKTIQMGEPLEIS